MGGMIDFISSPEVFTRRRHFRPARQWLRDTAIYEKHEGAAAIVIWSFRSGRGVGVVRGVLAYGCLGASDEPGETCKDKQNISW